MKFILIILPFLCAVSFASNEEAWTPVQISLDGTSSMTSFWKTADQRLRLESLAETYQTSLFIFGEEGMFRRTRTLRDVKQKCASSLSLMRLELRDNHRFRLKMMVNPLSAKVLDEGLQGMKIESRFYAAEVHPLITTKRLVYMSPDRLQDVQNQLEVLTQNSSIAKDGTLTMELTSIDDFVCDLAEGNVEINMRLMLSFEAAKLRREKVIAPEQVLRLGQSLTSLPREQQNQSSAAIRNAAYLGAELKEMFGNEFANFMQKKFPGLASQLMQLPSGNPITLNETSATKISRSLDNLHEGRDLNRTTIQSKTIWEREL